MNHAFDPTQQNTDLDSKILAGLERLSMVFRVLLRTQEKEYGLSSIQIQVLIFISTHQPTYNTVSYLAQEFNLTRATISDAVRVLEEKKLVNKIPNPTDSRSSTLHLTKKAHEIVQQLGHFADPVLALLAATPNEEKIQLWDTVYQMIANLNKAGIIDVQRMCLTCKYYSSVEKGPYCNLLKTPLHNRDIRLDCPEYEIKPHG
jgi:DNA-binding MarR family transcriptional regulator